MVPVVFIAFLILLSSFFMHLYLSFKIILVFIFFIVFIVFFFNKKISFFFLMSNLIFYFYHDYAINNYLKIHQAIVKGKNFIGIIINKKDLGKKYLYQINVYSYQQDKEKKKINAYISLITKKNLLVGEFVFIPYVFFLQKYSSIKELIKNPLNLSAHASGIPSDIKINTVFSYKKTYSFFRFLFEKKDSFENACKKYFIDENKFFFETIFLGKSVHNKIYKNLFFTWGISHFLARSGLHIQICISLLMGCFLFLGFSYFFSALIQLLLLFIFYFFTFPSISFFRAFLMFFLFLISKLFNLPTTSLHTLSVTAIITFFIYPYCFLQLGTQLTFFTTCILSLLSYTNQFIAKKTVANNI
jgi:hypothetical protein